MKVYTLLILAAFTLCAAGALAAPKVAYVHSAWGFENEFDKGISQLGWTMDKYQNLHVAQLAPKLNEYDMVIVGSTGNLSHTQDMTPYKAQWLDYLEKGGVLLIVDANYPSVIDSWINTFGPDFVLKTDGCAPHTGANGGSGEVTFDKAHPILYAPYDLREAFIKEGGIWCHIDSWPEGWTSLITCADNKSLFVYKAVGKGLVAVTNYASLDWREDKNLAEALPANLLLFTQFSKSGIKIESVDYPPATPGKYKASFIIENTSNEVKEVSLKFVSNPEGRIIATAATSTKIEPGSKGTVPFDIELIGRGIAHLTTEIITDGKDGIEVFRKFDIPDLLTFKPQYKHLYKESEVVFVSTIVPDADVSLTDCSLEISIDGKIVKTVKSPKSEDMYKADITKMSLGNHKVTARLLHNNAVLETVNEEIKLHPLARLHSREDGTLLIDGKPEYPFGWYTVSWTLSSQEKVDFIKAIGEAGFNAAHISARDADAWKIVLDAGQQYGVKVITEYGGDYQALIDTYKNHPAVLAWNPGDEPDLAGISPQEMLRRANSFKDVDPDHPSYMVLANPSTYEKYAGSADIIAPDIYPIPNGKISGVYSGLLNARTQANKYGRPIWAVVQCFGYDNPSSWRVPTVNEARNMTYQAFLAGAKGIIYYTYYDSGFDVRKFPELWQGMKDLVPEVNKMKPFLMNGLPTPIQTGNDDILACTWKNKGQNMLVVANVNHTENQEISILLPIGAEKTIKPLFDRDTHYISVKGNKLAGRLQALGAAVFKY